jgi:hypothetical protein
MMMKLARLLLFLSMALFAAPTSQSVALTRTATIQIRLVPGGGTGNPGATGELQYHGRRFALAISGLGAAAGGPQVELVGNVYKLRDPKDIEGSYSGVGAGRGVAGRGRVARLANAHGVILEVRGRQIGLKHPIDLNGMGISLAR